MKPSVMLLVLGPILIFIGALLKIQKLNYSSGVLTMGLVMEAVGLVPVFYKLITQKKSS